MGLVFHRKEQEQVIVKDHRGNILITITVVKNSRGQMSLDFAADKALFIIDRGEVHEEKDMERADAVRTQLAVGAP